MENMEDILAMVAGILGVLIILVPVLGLTLRMVAKPLAEAFTQARSGADAGPALRAVEQRLAALEEQAHEADRSLARLGEEVQFLRQLQEPQARPRLRADDDVPL